MILELRIIDKFPNHNTVFQKYQDSFQIAICYFCVIFLQNILSVNWWFFKNQMFEIL